MSDSTSLPALLSRAGERLGSLLPLAVVPFAIAVVSVERFRRIAESGADVRFGISFGFPTTVTTAWDLLSLPSAGPGLNLPTEHLGTTVLVMLVLAAGAGALAALPLALVFVLALFAFAYLFYAAPYLVVVEGVDLPTALRRSYGYATSGGESPRSPSSTSSRSRSSPSSRRRPSRLRARARRSGPSSSRRSRCCSIP
ncbi:hypothetical protein BRC93_07440 [Halobacteriales archaeon QS_5_70_15]|nr:MAG: hypothetical protein BRC93_07440 [Halobacteriales archaeon QS_5_70_15]